MTQRCKTKYPIILVHGSHRRDFKPYAYWGRIPDALRYHSASIFFGGQDAWGTLEANGYVIKTNIEKALRETGAKKINIIAHSKGGLDVRQMIEYYKMESLVASVTTIATPHMGSRSADRFFKWKPVNQNLFAKLMDVYALGLGDENPNFYRAFYQLTTKYCSGLNKRAPLPEGVYCQSFGCVMQMPKSDIVMDLPYRVVKKIEGDNDGLVTVTSAKWGNFRGVLRSEAVRGISHQDIVDLRRRSLKDFDVLKFYVMLIEELKIRGY